MPATKSKRTCAEGHIYYKRSDCPVCPVCEAAGTRDDFRDGLSNPARRALESAGIISLEELSTWRRSDLLKLHGIGPATIPKLEAALAAAGMTFGFSP